MNLKDEYWVCIEIDTGEWYTYSSHRTLPAARRSARAAARREIGYGSSIYIREVKTLPKEPQQ